MAGAIGGQAIIEGVMMRNGNRLAAAIRKDGKIKLKRFPFRPLTERNRLFGFPFVRGVFSLIDMLYMGTKTLMWSAKESAEEDDLELSGWHITATIIVSFAAALLLFMLLPYVLSYLLGLTEGSEPILFNVVDGLLKIGIFLGYVYVIGLMDDIKRIFEYHGAEHKAVNMHEAGIKQDLKKASSFTTIHTRCGTNFIFIVFLVGVFLFSFIPVILKALIPGLFALKAYYRFPLLFLSRLLVLPIVAGISYEFLKLQSSRFKVLRILSYPGLLLQKLTTREPSDDQLEVAFAALNAVKKSARTTA